MFFHIKNKLMQIPFPHFKTFLPLFLLKFWDLLLLSLSYAPASDQINENLQMMSMERL